SAAPGFFLPTILLGVTPVEPGFRKVRIAPQTCGLSWARGRVPTPHGEIAVSWSTEDDRIVLDVALPPSVAGEVHIGDEKRRLEDGGSGRFCATLEV
ncbi:MAG: alpha-L-rhamnosidase C-terminal domain-containing protein, partial [Armatimonadota bacterium]